MAIEPEIVKNFQSLRLSLRVSCDVCGNVILVPLPPRMNPRGNGAWYSTSQIKCPSPLHRITLMVLEDSEATSPETGLGLHDLWLRVSDACLAVQQKIPSKQSLSGRVSELVGLHLCRKARVDVKLWDQRTFTWRYKKMPVTYLASGEKEGEKLLRQRELFT